jgi:hypothetical protein
MLSWRRSLATAGALLALLPAAAAAQSAGDEQYSDPFANSEKPSKPPAATPAPAQPAQATAPAAPAQAAPAATAPSRTTGGAQAAQLPRTGWDALVPGALGLVMVSTGVALRARVRRDP